MNPQKLDTVILPVDFLSEAHIFSQNNYFLLIFVYFRSINTSSKSSMTILVIQTSEISKDLLHKENIFRFSLISSVIIVTIAASR